MVFNSNIFFLARPPSLIVWNCETHKQFELSANYQIRLLELIGDPDSFNSENPIDSSFFDAGFILSGVDAERSWGWDVLSKLFHVGTKNVPLESQPTTATGWATQYLEHCDDVLLKARPVEHYHKDFGDRIFLPKPLPCTENLSTVLTCRKTARNYNCAEVRLTTLSTILYYGMAYLSEREDEESAALPEGLRRRRSSPSGGGLNATEGYLYATNVESIPSGFYYYNPANHSLERRNPIGDAPLGALLNGQHFIDEIPFGIFLTSRLDKLWWKYEHSRTYRMALIEIGHIAQTIQLIATACGLQTWLNGALNESTIESLIKTEAGVEEVMFFVGGGYGDGSAIAESLKLRLERQATNNEKA
ncbi:SagB family peptide dehydrogenase [Pseudomonas caspiana]